jgi:hypothetical protein
MKTQYTTALNFRGYLAIISLLAFSGLCLGSPSMPEADSISTNPKIDDFNDATNNSLGIARQFLNDTVVGGNTTTEINVVEGVIRLKGEIVPPRGQPGWASSVFLLDPQGKPLDASEFDGVRLLVKVNAGNISISANSIEVTNFDYHAAQVVVAADGKFHEIKIPFNSMKRAWSEQTPLNTKTISGLSIVAFALQKADFDFEIDEVSFY